MPAFLFLASRSGLRALHRADEFGDWPEDVMDLITGADGRIRCWWPGSDPLYLAYHDTEWGRPVDDDRRLFEKICLEGFQSGLSWLTILRKRENFRAAFAGFDIARVARFGSEDVQRCLGDAGIVRHRGKIESVVNNARRALELTEEAGSLAAFVWRFEPPLGSRPAPNDRASIAPSTPQSVALSKELRKRGWSFVGPTTTYAFMQSVGIVNDHLEGCSCRDAVEEERLAFTRPGLGGGGEGRVVQRPSNQIPGRSGLES